ncbi:MAG: hypothetical protein JNJ92_03255 [Altererythrobacter sp.]|nr:hypothetical protein [Altererythrobacter sp.]
MSVRYELWVWSGKGHRPTEGFGCRAEAKIAFDHAVVGETCDFAAVYDLESDGGRVGKATHQTLWAFPSWWDGHT